MTFSTAISRGLKLRCPRCGGGRLFRGYFRMYPNCPNCKLKYERDPGYFLGSAYINYGLTSLILTVSYVVPHFVFKVENGILIGPLAAFCVLFPLFFFRYARSLWLAMDCHIDVTGFDIDQDHLH